MALKHVDFGFHSARDFWEAVALPAYERFRERPTPAHAIEAAFAVWHVHDWVFVETPSLETAHRSRKQYEAALVQICPELELIRDVADAGKHRGLSRKPRVKSMGDKPVMEGPFGAVAFGELAFSEVRIARTPLLLTLDDGKIKAFAQVLAGAVEYWRVNYFP